MLTDRFGRIHNYLRISVTDNCNFRCVYCMPGGCHSFLRQEQLMTPAEIEALASVFVSLGVDKIRLTGGEPLVRKDFDEILHRLSGLKAELLVTTNGSLVHRHMEAFREAGVNSVNVSLDSLRPESFEKITRLKAFEQVRTNIMMLLDHGIKVKINAVAMRGSIEDELYEFIELTRNHPFHVRFIEFMPFDGNGWNKDKVITAGEMISIVQEHYDIVKLKDEPHATARKYQAIGHAGTFAFITTMSNQFCGDCNRLRLTAEGKMKNCLFGQEELDLLHCLRTGGDVASLIRQSVQNKHAAMGGQFENGYEQTDASQIVNRSMIRIGG